MSDHENANFGLTQKEFAALRTGLLDGTSEKLFEHVFLAHFASCQQFVEQKDQAPAHLAYDATMEAFLDFRQKIIQGKVTYGNLRWLLTRMSRQQYYRLARKEMREELTVFPEEPVSQPVVWENDDYATIKREWSKLGEKCRRILHAFYYQGRSLKDIAFGQGKSAASVRKRKERCLQQLKTAVGVKA